MALYYTTPARSPRGLYDARCTNLGLVCEFLLFCRLLQARGLVPDETEAEAADGDGLAWSWADFLDVAGPLLTAPLDAADGDDEGFAAFDSAAAPSAGSPESPPSGPA